MNAEHKYLILRVAFFRFVTAFGHYENICIDGIEKRRNGLQSAVRITDGFGIFCCRRISRRISDEIFTDVAIQTVTLK